jgi:transketolase
LPATWQADCEQRLTAAQAQALTVATRKASQNALDLLGPVVPELVGGSADLTGSNLTQWAGAAPMHRDDFNGSYIYYGVREFAMCAIGNGIALHGGAIPYAGTFLMFSEYARNALRMAALMKIRNILVFTHDSIGLGEDGPTHQAVEQAATLRMMPNMSVWRPCDAVESLAAWQQAISRTDGPSSLLFSRQGLPHQERTAAQVADINKGGYVLVEASAAPALVLIATGSEVALATQAARQLEAAGTPTRVVSMPSTDVFDRQTDAYKGSVLHNSGDAGCKRIAIEAGAADYWYKYVGLDGDIVGMHSFGESAPAEQVFKHFGFTVENVVTRANALLNRNA